jgi:hypothetical protein
MALVDITDLAVEEKRAFTDQYFATHARRIYRELGRGVMVVQITPEKGTLLPSYVTPADLDKYDEDDWTRQIRPLVASYEPEVEAVIAYVNDTEGTVQGVRIVRIESVS